MSILNKTDKTVQIIQDWKKRVNININYNNEGGDYMSEIPYKIIKI